jgi:hypothetical protein
MDPRHEIVELICEVGNLPEHKKSYLLGRLMADSAKDERFSRMLLKEIKQILGAFAKDPADDIRRSS